MKPEDRILTELIEETEQGRMVLAQHLGANALPILRKLEKQGLVRGWTKKSKHSGRTYTLWEAK